MAAVILLIVCRQQKAGIVELSSIVFFYALAEKSVVGCNAFAEVPACKSFAGISSMYRALSFNPLGM